MHRDARRAFHRFLVLSALLAVTSCGGGGGGGGSSAPPVPTLVSLSPSTLNFSAATPSARAPASQNVTATITGITGGTLYVFIAIDGAIVTSVSTPVINPATQQGTAAVNVGSPANLGAGPHSTAITVSACLSNVVVTNCSGIHIAGSPKTTNVSYNVGSSVQADAVAPYLGTGGVPGNVILRGQGFTPVTSVSFGGTPSVAPPTVVSDTEIHVDYPALTAGIYAVTLNGGAVAFNASLRIIDAPAYATTTLAYPSAPQLVRGLVYDAERAALLVALSFANTANNTLLRYAYLSGWPVTPDSIPFANLRDIALSQNAAKLLAISDASMTELNPSTLGTITTVAKPDSFFFGANEFMRGLAVANDGIALVTTGYNGSGDTGLYGYSASQSAFSPMFQAGNNPLNVLSYAVAGTGANGATVALVQSGVSPAQPIIRYSASTGILAASNVALNLSTPSVREHINAPAFDRASSVMIVPQAVGGGSPYSAYDANFGSVGDLPSTTAGYAVSPDGARAYTLEIASPCQVRAFDLASPTGAGNPLTEVVTGFPITLASCPANTAFPQSIKMLVNPAGDTLFIAGNLQINVVQLP